MRHNLLDLDPTIPYDQEEQEESYLADMFRDLFGDTDVPDPVPGLGDSVGPGSQNQSQAGRDTQSGSDADIPDSQQDMGTSMPIPLPAINNQLADLSPQSPRTTRRVRAIVPPKYLSSYQTHM